MAKTAWWEEEQVTAAILGTPGVSAIPASFVVADEIAAMIERVEGLTGFDPFLAGDPSTRRYDPPSWLRGDADLLDLGCGYVSVSSVKVGVSPTYAGDALTVDEEYWLEPFDAPDRKRPYTWLRFASAQSGSRKSVEITGVRGFASEIPADLWRAGLDALIAQALVKESGKVGAASRIKQGPVELEYRVESGESTVERFMKRLGAVALKYRRV